ncbi:MAG: RHS repeat-associated core domain-containing protein [Bacteroidota bacterium]|nr:RHS repeat-associated core domain-containing protein [Bacteroidota bacterium]
MGCLKLDILEQSVSSFSTGLDRKRALSEHLGNVLSTVTDRKLPIDLSANQQVDYFNADIAGANDYYPFGMLQVNRSYSLSQYRFGFNGKEMDNEVSGTGNQYDYGFRIYNPRIAKFLSVDPLTKSFPWYSPYQFAGNMPIAATDLDGLEVKLAIFGEGAGHENIFKARSNTYVERLSSNFPVEVHGVRNGQEFIELLKTKTEEFGSISGGVVYSHGWSDGIEMSSSNGLYIDGTTYWGGGKNQAFISEISEAMGNGEIIFEDNAIFIFFGCNNNGYLDDDYALTVARNFTSATGVTSIAARGHISPVIEDEKETGESHAFAKGLYKEKPSFYKIELNIKEELIESSLGDQIDPVDFDPPVYLKKARTNPINVSLEDEIK